MLIIIILMDVILYVYAIVLMISMMGSFAYQYCKIKIVWMGKIDAVQIVVIMIYEL